MRIIGIGPFSVCFVSIRGDKTHWRIVHPLLVSMAVLFDWSLVALRAFYRHATVIPFQCRQALLRLHEPEASGMRPFAVSSAGRIERLFVPYNPCEKRHIPSDIGEFRSASYTCYGPQPVQVSKCLRDRLC